MSVEANGVESKGSIFSRGDFRRFERERRGVVCSRHSNATRESMFHQRKAREERVGIRKRPVFPRRFPRFILFPFEQFLLVSLRVARPVLFRARNKYVSRRAVFRRLLKLGPDASESVCLTNITISTRVILDVSVNTGWFHFHPAERCHRHVSRLQVENST